jgi:hypothetical protein
VSLITCSVSLITCKVSLITRKVSLINAAECLSGVSLIACLVSLTASSEFNHAYKVSLSVFGELESRGEFYHVW